MIKIINVLHSDQCSENGNSDNFKNKICEEAIITKISIVQIKQITVICFIFVQKKFRIIYVIVALLELFDLV